MSHLKNVTEGAFEGRAETFNGSGEPFAQRITI